MRRRRGSMIEYEERWIGELEVCIQIITPSLTLPYNPRPDN